MIKRTIWEWEKLDHYTFRIKVRGGWIVKMYEECTGIASAFIPDPYHEWEILKEPVPLPVNNVTELPEILKNAQR